MNLIATAGGDWDPETPVAASMTMAWRVPVDDESCISFNITRIPVTGEAAEQYIARRRERAGRAFIPPSKLAEAVLRGDFRIEDITEPTIIVNVQDYVAQIGQGVIAPREQDRLGRSDVLVILLRKIWERELGALAGVVP